MIQSVTLHNYGHIHDLAWSNTGPINAVISPNALSKTFLLKALAFRTLAMYLRVDAPSSLNTILVHKLSMIHQYEKIRDLVTKGAAGSLPFSMQYNEQILHLPVWQQRNPEDCRYGEHYRAPIEQLNLPSHKRSLVIPVHHPSSPGGL